MKREWIQNQVKGLIEFCSSNNVFDICNYLNIAVKKVDKNYLLLNNKDSIYFRNFNNDELILLRNDLPCEYEKFVLAHKVGHPIENEGLSLKEILAKYHLPFDLDF